MKTFAPLTILFLISWILAVVCIWSSVSVMKGYEDCTKNDGITISPAPGEPICANFPELSFLYSSILAYSGIGLFILPFGVAIVLKWREKHSNKIEIELIKIVV